MKLKKKKSDYFIFLSEDALKNFHWEKKKVIIFSFQNFGRQMR